VKSCELVYLGKLVFESDEQENSVLEKLRVTLAVIQQEMC